MTSHEQCRHSQTPAARRACRMLRRVLAVAERYELVVTDVTDTTATPVIPQFTIGTRRDWDWDTKLLITAGYNTPRLSVRSATGSWRDEPWRDGRNACAWLGIMREDDERERAQ